MNTWIALALAALLLAAPASAQTYASAALSGDFSKSYETTTDGIRFGDTESAAIGWALRLGTAFADRWGVELEFHRSGELEAQMSPIFYARALTGSTSPLTPPVFDPAALSFPAFEFETEQRTTTWNASLWVRRPLGTRADLVVLAGVGFARVVQESEFSFGISPLLPAPIRAPSSTRTTAYGTGPLVGVEARVRMTGQLAIVPGIRVQGLSNDLAPGLLLRPSVAIGWTF
jgi:hypothetical protein